MGVVHPEGSSRRREPGQPVSIREDSGEISAARRHLVGDRRPSAASRVCSSPTSASRSPDPAPRGPVTSAWSTLRTSPPLPIWRRGRVGWSLRNASFALRAEVRTMHIVHSVPAQRSGSARRRVCALAQLVRDVVEVRASGLASTVLVRGIEQEEGELVFDDAPSCVGVVGGVHRRSNRGRRAGGSGSWSIPARRAASRACQRRA